MSQSEELDLMEPGADKKIVSGSFRERKSLKKTPIASLNSKHIEFSTVSPKKNVIFKPPKMSMDEFVKDSETTSNPINIKKEFLRYYLETNLTVSKFKKIQESDSDFDYDYVKDNKALVIDMVFNRIWYGSKYNDNIEIIVSELASLRKK